MYFNSSINLERHFSSPTPTNPSTCELYSVITCWCLTVTVILVPKAKSLINCIPLSIQQLHPYSKKQKCGPILDSLSGRHCWNLVTCFCPMNVCWNKQFNLFPFVCKYQLEITCKLPENKSALSHCLIQRPIIIKDSIPAEIFKVAGPSTLEAFHNVLQKCMKQRGLKTSAMLSLLLSKTTRGASPTVETTWASHFFP